MAPKTEAEIEAAAGKYAGDDWELVQGGPAPDSIEFYADSTDDDPDFDPYTDDH